ncbi:MAG TPA: YIP1 family protein, partial [Chloroflexia bacterium]
TFWAPILIAGNIPIIGGILGFVGGLYSLYLTYLALQPTHRMDSTKAMTVVGILIAIAVVLGLCAFFTVGLAFLGLAAAGGGR